jgi:tetratricopeptide (TPR) repeat protein
MSRKARFSISLIIVFTVFVSSVVLRYLPEPPELPEIQPETAEMATIELASATKDKSMVPMLIDVVSNRLKSTEARCKAAEALGVIGDPQALLALTNVSKEAGVEDRIRVYALWALGNISAAEDKQEKGFDYSEFLLGQIQEYDLVLSFDSTNPYAYLGRGIAHIEQYEYSQAIADFDKAIMYKPSLAKAYYQRGIAHMLEGESQQAVEDFTAAIRWNLSGADIYCRRGAAHQSSHDLDLALDDFSKCLSLDPTRTEAYLSLGLVYREMRQYEQSLQAFQSYLLHSPDAPDATQVEEWILEIEKQIRE